MSPILSPKPPSLRDVTHYISSNLSRIWTGMVRLYPILARAHFFSKLGTTVYMLNFEELKNFPLFESQNESENQAISSLISTKVRLITMKLRSHVQWCFAFDFLLMFDPRFIAEIRHGFDMKPVIDGAHHHQQRTMNGSQPIFNQIPWPLACSLQNRQHYNQA